MPAGKSAAKKAGAKASHATKNTEQTGKTVAAKKDTSKPGAKPSYSVERSRCQVLLKTGLKGPGQYQSIKFHKLGGEKEAIAYGKQWVASKITGTV